MGGLSNGAIPDSHEPQTEELQIGDHRLSTSCGVVERPITIVVMTLLWTNSELGGDEVLT